MSRLVLHAGASETTRQDVFNVPTPEPSFSENGRGYYPIPHALLIETIEANLSAAGLHVVQEQHSLGHDGDSYFGLLDVRNGENRDDYGLAIGIRNGHNKQFSAGLALGSRVFVCDNLAFNGEVTLARKHTRFIERDLPALVARSIGMLQDQRQIQDQRFDAYKLCEIDDRQVHDFVIRSIDARAVPLTKIPQVLHHWRKPPYEEFEPRTLWSLFNAFTEEYKQQAPRVTCRRSQILHALADSQCGLVLRPRGGVEMEDAEILVNGIAV